MKKLFGALHFFLRFLPSFTAPPFNVRRRGWTPLPRLDGQTWLVTGASDGIGRAITEQALALGAQVVGVARNDQVLSELEREGDGHFTGLRYDLSLMRNVQALVDRLSTSDRTFDVVINNVGVLLHEGQRTDEGLEQSFATNVVGHFALTNGLREAARLAADARVVNMSSGGMYNVPLLIERLNTTDAYNGTLAYAMHKRAQVVLNDVWRAQDAGRRYFVMHPGWVNTTGVRTSLPQFHKTLGRILRTPEQGADTALWLGATGPEQSTDGIWFDRKLRDAHIHPSTRTLSASGEVLERYLDEVLNDALSDGAEPVAASA